MLVYILYPETQTSFWRVTGYCIIEIRQVTKNRVWEKKGRRRVKIEEKNKKVKLQVKIFKNKDGVFKNLIRVMNNKSQKFMND